LFQNKDKAQCFMIGSNIRLVLAVEKTCFSFLVDLDLAKYDAFQPQQHEWANKKVFSAVCFLINLEHDKREQVAVILEEYQHLFSVF